MQADHKSNGPKPRNKTEAMLPPDLIEARRTKIKRVRKADKPLATAAEHYKANELDLYIETVLGNKFFIEHPTFDIKEVIHALSLQCRYTGHSKLFYSVAEHSVLVAQIVKDLKLGDPFEGLMHDGAEAYLSDIAAPWKALLPDYKRLEAKVEIPMRFWLGFEGDRLPDGIKRADWLALFVEARALIPSRASDWLAPDGIKAQADTLNYKINCWSPAIAQGEFRNAFRKYAPARCRQWSL